MKKRKSQRRRVRNAATPMVQLSSNYYNPTLEFQVGPCGGPVQVVFELDGRQWRALVLRVQERRREVAERYLALAKKWSQQ